MVSILEHGKTINFLQELFASIFAVQLDDSLHVPT